MTGLLLVLLVLASMAAGYGLHAHDVRAARVRRAQTTRHLSVVVPEQRKAS